MSETARPEHYGAARSGERPVRAILALDPSEMPLGPEGIADYVWPVPRSELEAVRDRLLASVTGVVRRHLNRSDADWQVLRILLYEIVLDALQVYQAVALRRRTLAAGYSLRFAGGFRLHRALDAGTRPDGPAFVASLKRGLTRPGAWVLRFKPLRNRLIRDSFRRRRIERIRDEEDIVAIAANPFMQRHAELVRHEQGRAVALCSFWEWMSANDADRQAMAATAPAPRSAVEDLVNACSGVFDSAGEPLAPLVGDYFVDWITDASRVVGYYYERLLRRPECLPRTLWYGSTNNVWTRTLRAAVRETGGRNLGHDHGRGISLCPNRGEHGAVLDLCDEYVAYSPFLAQEFAALRDDFVPLLPESCVPRFTGRVDLYLPPPSPPRRSTPPRSFIRRHERSVMYAATMFSGENLGFNCLPPAPVTADWQCRLFGRLGDWGYDILFKGHPECRFGAPDAYRVLLGATPIDGYVEDCYGIADIFLFDFLSSHFKTLAFTDKPLVFVDFGFGALSSASRQTLQRRVAIVGGWFDEENRAQVTGASCAGRSTSPKSWPETRRVSRRSSAGKR